MQVSILQAVSIVMTGNAILQGWNAGDWWPRHWVFDGCPTVRFTESRGVWFGRIGRVAANPRTLIDIVKASGGQFRLGLARPRVGADHVDALRFHDGWVIETFAGASASGWTDQWDFHDRFRDSGFWTVEYRRTDPPVRLARYSVLTCAPLFEELEITLAGIADFARSQNWSNFAGLFDRGLIALNAREPIGKMDLAPAGFLHPQAQRLLDVVAASWQFGGMGAWNDIGPFRSAEADDTYRCLTARLLDNLQEALLTASNSTCIESQVLIEPRH